MPQCAVPVGPHRAGKRPPQAPTLRRRNQPHRKARTNGNRSHRRRPIATLRGAPEAAAWAAAAQGSWRRRNAPRKGHVAAPPAATPDGFHHSATLPIPCPRPVINPRPRSDRRTAPHPGLAPTAHSATTSGRPALGGPPAAGPRRCPLGSIRARAATPHLSRDSKEVLYSGGCSRTVWHTAHAGGAEALTGQPWKARMHTCSAGRGPARGQRVSPGGVERSAAVRCQDKAPGRRGGACPPK